MEMKFGIHFGMLRRPVDRHFKNIKYDQHINFFVTGEYDSETGRFKLQSNRLVYKS